MTITDKFSSIMRTTADAFKIAELVEAEQGVVAGAARVSVVRCAFLEPLVPAASPFL